MVAERLKAVRARMDAAASAAGRPDDSVTLVAVSKTAGPEGILEAYRAGHRDFGENRSHELVAKAAVLPDDIRWHFVGALQSRKAKDIAPLASFVHSIDRPSLLRAWARSEGAAKVLLQLNLAGEEQKHGARVAELDGLLDLAAELGVDVAGLMLMPPLVADPEENRRWFHMLRTLRDARSGRWPRLVELSMGMTDDFEVAIGQGATLIRVGRAIFAP